MGASGADPGEESLYYYLRSQVRFEELSEPMARAVECVLESLNSSGWLDEPDADLAAHAGVDGDTVARAVEVVQGLEPAGVAARTLSECLTLQLERRGERGLPLTIAKSYLEAMSSGPLQSDCPGDRGQPGGNPRCLQGDPGVESKAGGGLRPPRGFGLHHSGPGGGQL